MAQFKLDQLREEVGTIAPPPTVRAVKSATPAHTERTATIAPEPSDEHDPLDLAAEIGTETDDAPADEADKSHPAEERRAGSGRGRTGGKARTTNSTPTIDLPESIANRFKKAWKSGVTKGNRRTYLEILLDAVENQAPALETHWKNSDDDTEDTKPRLFASQNARAKRKQAQRHREPVIRFTLSGMTRDDIEQFAELQEQWGAPTFVELVTVALDRDLPRDAARRRRGQRADASDD